MGGGESCSAFCGIVVLRNGCGMIVVFTPGAGPTSDARWLLQPEHVLHILEYSVGCVHVVHAHLTSRTCGQFGWPHQCTNTADCESSSPTGSIMTGSIMPTGSMLTGSIMRRDGQKRWPCLQHVCSVSDLWNPVGLLFDWCLSCVCTCQVEYSMCLL